MSNQSNETKFFDLHTTGIGYLNRIREVSPRKGKPFTCVTVAALHGATDKAEYSYIDCNVVGAEAELLVKRCQQAVEANKKVLVSFRIGDIWADAFTYDKGEKKGQAGASLKGRLLFIGWIKVDGKLVYEAKPKNATPPADNQGKPGVDQPLNQEQPVLEQSMNQEQPVLEPSMNQEQPVLEQSMNQEQPVLEQSMNQEQPVLEQPVNQEQSVAGQFGEQPEPAFGDDLSQEAHQAA